ncbi:MAG: DUF86 domain-containing protein [Alphaproteobacteria bacterium]|nr:DUF86 domain-containing protein [Alphaproteobacteria bacterium]MBU2379792.1 DUF86 domain-containing protein [Alphaproteobacteria bacterium]
MKNPAIRDRLQDIVAYGREAVEAVADLSAEQILAERFREHAVLRTVQVVGEASAQLLKLDPAMQVRIPHIRRAVDLRNMLVHGYTKIRMEEIVRIVRSDLPDLIDRATAILGEDYQ